MRRFLTQHRARILNVGLRLASLVAKLGLTLYMGRYLSLADLGAYGLVFGTVMALGCFIGMKLDYVVSREVVDASPLNIVHIMRDQAIFYGITFVITAGVVALAAHIGFQELNAKIVFFILALTFAETFATMTYTNMNSMGQQVLANVLFFVRSGLWAFPVMVLGIVAPEYRTVDTVLTAWLLGVIACHIATLWIWRNLPWVQAMKKAIDWAWIRKGVVKCFPLWLGALGITGGMYVDRFVVNHFLGIEKVGVATFYLSFATALFTLVQSGVLSFTYPKLISLYKQREITNFWKEVRETVWHVVLFAGAIAVGVGVVVPLLGEIMHKQEFVDEALTLWLVLGGMWLRANAETLYYVLFARHQDKPIWLGNLLYLVPTIGGNAVLVPLFGLSGIGYSALISGACLLLWRWWHVRNFKERAA